MTTAGDLIVRETNSPLARYLLSLAPGSRRSQLARLRCILGLLTDRPTAEVSPEEAAGFAWTSLSLDQLAVLRARIQERLALSHANVTLSAIRGVLREADKLTPPVVRTLRNVKGTTPLAGRMLAPKEQRALFKAAAAKGGPSSVRNGAMLALGLGLGLRISEVVGLKVSDYSDDALEVSGKGNTRARMHLRNGAKDALADWVSIRGSSGTFLFVPVIRGEVRSNAHHLSTQTVEKTLKVLARKASIPAITWHDLRRTCISTALGLSDLATVSRLARHASVVTTARYDRRGDEQVRELASLINVPYVRPE